MNENAAEFLELLRDDALITSNVTLPIQHLIVTFALGFNHRFCPQKCHKNIRLRDNNRCAKLAKRDGWSRRVHCNQIMTSGLHFIEFKIDNLTEDMSIGISNPNSGVSRFVGFDGHSYSLACKGKLQPKSDADFDDPFAKHWDPAPFYDDELVGMLLDLDRLTLTYFKNGQCLGKAFNVKDTKGAGYVFAVSMAVRATWSRGSARSRTKTVSLMNPRNRLHRRHCRHADANDGGWNWRMLPTSLRVQSRLR